MKFKIVVEGKYSNIINRAEVYDLPDAIEHRYHHDKWFFSCSDEEEFKWVINELLNKNVPFAAVTEEK